MPDDVAEHTRGAQGPSRPPVAHACAQLRATLHRLGLRCTPHRLAVVTLLAGQTRPGHLTAGEIRGALADAGHHLDNATVYRVLAVLVDTKTVHATTLPDGATSYGLALDPHHHAVCTRCGQVSEIAARPIEELVVRAAGASRYRIDDSVLLSGMCPGCQSAPPTTWPPLPT